jgi:error-prone DNA polymerase
VKHTVETDRRRTWGVRLALSGVRGISEEECARIEEGPAVRIAVGLLAAGPPQQPVAERLAEIGALDLSARRAPHPP